MQYQCLNSIVATINVIGRGFLGARRSAISQINVDPAVGLRSLSTRTPTPTHLASLSLSVCICGAISLETWTTAGKG